MPVLNPEIFTDVLIECLKKKNDSRTLGKFMLSGQQQFRCAVNYFCKAKSVEIMDERIRVCVKIGRITRYHEISYQFSMINLIMKILGSSIDEFQILSCPEKFNAIEYFLDKKIKNVIVYEDLSPKYRTLIASCDFIEKVTVILFTLYARPFDMIPPSCRKLKCKVINFDGCRMGEIMKNFKEDVKDIEHLEIDSHHFAKRYTSSFILNNFPKLQSVEMVATYHGEIKYVIEMLKDKKLSFLQRLGKSKITGKLVFKNQIRPRSKCVIPEFEKVLQDVHDIAGVTSDAENQKITRTVELKENLIVEFILSFTPDYDYYKAR